MSDVFIIEINTREPLIKAYAASAEPFPFSFVSVLRFQAQRVTNYALHDPISILFLLCFRIFGHTYPINGAKLRPALAQAYRLELASSIYARFRFLAIPL